MKAILSILLFLALNCSAQIGLRSPAFVGNMHPNVYSPGTDGNVVEWLKADAISASDGDAVQWVASVGQDANNGTSLLRPLYKSNIKNSLPVVRFDGITQWLQTAALTTVNQPLTIYIAFKYSSSGVNSIMIGPRTSANDVRFSALSGNAGFNMFSGNASILLVSSDNNWHISQLIYNGASSSYRFDGGTRTTLSSTPGAEAWSGLTLGAFYDGITQPAACDIGEVIVRNNGDTANEAAIFSYLNARWAVY